MKNKILYTALLLLIAFSGYQFFEVDAKIDEINQKQVCLSEGGKMQQYYSGNTTCEFTWDSNPFVHNEVLTMDTSWDDKMQDWVVRETADDMNNLLKGTNKIQYKIHE